ncbi:hypothetical protein MRB53_017070 [Persea americana]|uniref:Uncharacterized protein n=1 Tax=Persea americana TaxID=3435 RepID=A0ACC2M3N3_PERAE|nr:hypothetical protein MRB53_017070 [Persea americana]
MEMGFWRVFFFIIVSLSLIKYLTVEATRPWHGAVPTSRENHSLQQAPILGGFNHSGCSYTPGDDDKCPPPDADFYMTDFSIESKNELQICAGRVRISRHPREMKDNAFSAVAVDVDGWDGSLTGSITTGV